MRNFFTLTCRVFAFLSKYLTSYLSGSHLAWVCICDYVYKQQQKESKTKGREDRTTCGNGAAAQKILLTARYHFLQSSLYLHNI